MAPHLKIIICALFASGANAIAKRFISVIVEHVYKRKSWSGQSFL